MRTDPTTRRKFLGTAGAMAAASALPASVLARAPGASDRISIGIIGCGDRGSTHLAELGELKDQARVEVTAICDVWSKARERAGARAERLFGKAPRLVSRVDDLLALGDVDGW